MNDSTWKTSSYLRFLELTNSECKRTLIRIDQIESITDLDYYYDRPERTVIKTITGDTLTVRDSYEEVKKDMEAKNA